MKMAGTAPRRERVWKRVRRAERRARWTPAVNDAQMPSILNPHIRREAR